MSQGRLIATSKQSNDVFFLVPTGVAGGQSALFSVENESSRVALVPVEAEDRDEYFKKAAAIIEKGLKHKNFAFPLEVLYCPKEKGFTKPLAILLARIPGATLEELLYPGERESHGLHWDTREFRIVAREVAKLFAFSEYQGFCQNDTHPGQYLVEWSADGTPTRVCRVDTLAVSFWHKNVYHGTDKARWEYVAWELHHLKRRRQGLKGFEIPREADRFGLACLLFELLTGGKHTDYAGEEPEAEKRVERKEFAVISMPKGARVPDQVEEAYYRLPSELRTLFERAFLGDPKNRPSPVEWLAALKDTPEERPVAQGLPMPFVAAPLGAWWRQVKAWAGTQNVGLVGVVALVAALCLLPRGGFERPQPEPARALSPSVASDPGWGSSQKAPPAEFPELPPPKRRAVNPDAVKLLNQR